MCDIVFMTSRTKASPDLTSNPCKKDRRSLSASTWLASSAFRLSASTWMSSTSALKRNYCWMFILIAMNPSAAFVLRKKMRMSVGKKVAEQVGNKVSFPRELGSNHHSRLGLG